VRVTANDGAKGEEWLRQFQDNEKTIPTILTTSQKLSTGVDARNVRNIVLMRPVNSMIEFKQIIGRGTRLFDGKDYFTIYDFVKAYQLFSDPEWDGEPIEPEPCSRCGKNPCECEKTPPKPCKVCGQSPCVCDEKPPEECPVCGEYPCVCDKQKKKLKIKLADGKERTIQHMAVTTFWGPDGKPISAAEFLQRLYGQLPELFKDEDELRAVWSKPDTRSALMEKLAEEGFGREQMQEIKRIIDAENSDVFDVLSYVAFALPTMTREERVTMHKGHIYEHYDYKQQAFIEFVLAQYIREGVEELDQSKLPRLLELKYNAISDAAAELGNISAIRDVFVGFQQYLYQE
jgi:type I restriction enzyme R subunit